MRYAGRLKVIRQTKFYDLFAAAPLIVWLVVSVVQMLPELAEQTVLAKAFFQISPSALPVSLALRILSKVCTLAFLAVLVFMFAVRRVPRSYAHGFYPRFAAMVGAFVSVGIVWLPWQQLSATLYLVSLLRT